MRRKISKGQPLTTFVQTQDRDLYIADFTRRTNGARSVEVHTTLPLSPDGGGAMDCLYLRNVQPLLIEFGIFNDNEFTDSFGNNIEHCECCLYPLPANNRNWIAFVELKDCDEGNVLKYKEKVKRQILDACARFRSMGIPCRNAYGLISCPRKKTGYNDSLFFTPLELWNLKRMTQIDFIVMNNGIIVDNEAIRPILKH